MQEQKNIQKKHSKNLAKRLWEKRSTILRRPDYIAMKSNMLERAANPPPRLVNQLETRWAISCTSGCGLATRASNHGPARERNHGLKPSPTITLSNLAHVGGDRTEGTKPGDTWRLLGTRTCGKKEEKRKEKKRKKKRKKKKKRKLK